MCASKNFIEQALIEEKVNNLKEKISKYFGEFNVNLKLKWCHAIDNRNVFSIKTKGNTREAHVRANAPEVQRKLKLPLFHVVKWNFNLYLIVSWEQPVYGHLPDILNTPSFRKAQKQMCLPYIAGHDVLGRVIMDDLDQFPHLLLGGSTNSGKSVGLQALITSISSSKPPSKVNFILIDVGANDLMPFEGIPHLSCPIVQNRAIAEYVLKALFAEMERRIALERDSPNEFRWLPRLVLVIDEFPALFMGAGKEMSKEFINILSSLLQRGRHTKIHLVLAAQNPTIQNMKIDLGNITARIAFQCAKRNFSETILGDRGAENLMGKGDLLFKSPLHSDLQRIQGVYVSPRELQQAVEKIKGNLSNYIVSNKFEILIPDDNADWLTNPTASFQPPTLAVRPSDDDRMFAQVVCWALEKETLSINMLMTEFNFGWNRATKYVRRLEEWGIVDNPKNKLPRHVIPMGLKDLSAEFIEFMQYCGISEDNLFNILVEK